MARARAAVQLLKKNYGKVVEDCEQALKLQPGNIKAYFRAARACNGLHKYPRALEFCEEGLRRDPGNAELGKERTAAQEGLKRREDENKRKQAQVSRRRRRQPPPPPHTEARRLAWAARPGPWTCTAAGRRRVLRHKGRKDASRRDRRR